MKTEDAVAYFGSTKALARFLDIYPQGIYMWKGDAPPKCVQYELEVRTRGGLKAEKRLRGNTATTPQVEFYEED